MVARYTFLLMALALPLGLSFVPSGVMNPIGRLGGGAGAGSAGASLTQRFKNLFELVARIATESVMRHSQRLGLVLQRIQPLGQALVGIGQLAKLRKGPHHIHRHFNRARAIEDGGAPSARHAR